MSQFAEYLLLSEGTDQLDFFACHSIHFEQSSFIVNIVNSSNSATTTTFSRTIIIFKSLDPHTSGMKYREFEVVV